METNTNAVYFVLFFVFFLFLNPNSDNEVLILMRFHMCIYKGHLESILSDKTNASALFCNFKVSGLDPHKKVMGSSFASAPALHQN